MRPIKLPQGWGRRAGLAGAALCWVGAALAAPTSTVRVQEATMPAPRAGFASSIVAMTLTSPQPAELVRATLAGARAVELQTLHREGSTVDMRRVPAITLPAGTPVHLRTAPGAFHLMALHLKRPPVPGSLLPMQLWVKDSASGRLQRLDVKVRVLPARGSGHDHEHDEH